MTHNSKISVKIDMPCKNKQCLNFDAYFSTGVSISLSLLFRTCLQTLKSAILQWAMAEKCQDIKKGLISGWMKEELPLTADIFENLKLLCRMISEVILKHPDNLLTCLETVHWSFWSTPTTH